MKSLSIKSVILLLLVLAFGCSAIGELTEDGIGQPISTVIDRYGPPSRVTPDGMGGERLYLGALGGYRIWQQPSLVDYVLGRFKRDDLWMEIGRMIEPNSKNLNKGGTQ